MLMRTTILFKLGQLNQMWTEQKKKENLLKEIVVESALEREITMRQLGKKKETEIFETSRSGKNCESITI